MLSSACAFSNIDLTLPTRGLEHPVTGGNGRQVVVVSPFADERETKWRCGMQTNGYDMDTADAVCQGDPNVWLAQILANELRTTGFTVLTPDAPHKPGALRVEGSLAKLFVEPIHGFWTGSLEADLFVRLRVSSDTGLEADRGFFVKGWRGGQIASVTGPYNIALDRATQQTLEEMVRAIVELMDKYPQLGDAGGSSFDLTNSEAAAR
ncbi:MAG TPA: hypothetical protein VMR86_02525 [Myxococcota bacterium]|nr:hypothetical protein [Myxococcota bacterium]